MVGVGDQVLWEATQREEITSTTQALLVPYALADKCSKRLYFSLETSSLPVRKVTQDRVTQCSLDYSVL